MSAVIVDANVVIAIAAREAGRDQKAITVIGQFSTQGCDFYAPGTLLSECMYVLCHKQQSGQLSPADYAQALLDLETFLSILLPSPSGDFALVQRATQIASGYGCSRTADAIYIALAEALQSSGQVVLLTFDAGLAKQAAKHTPLVTVTVL